MKPFLIFLAALLFCFAAAAKKRPHIFGIAYVPIAVTNTDEAKQFYSLALAAAERPSALHPHAPCNWCEITLDLPKEPIRFRAIEFEPKRDAELQNRLLEVALPTDNAANLRFYLKGQHVAAEKMTKCAEDPVLG